METKVTEADVVCLLHQEGAHFPKMLFLDRPKFETEIPNNSLKIFLVQLWNASMTENI